MVQVTVCLDDELEIRMRAAADAARLPQSAWLARLIQERLADRWPEDVAALAGAWNDFPETDALRKGLSHDVPREVL